MRLSLAKQAVIFAIALGFGSLEGATSITIHLINTTSEDISCTIRAKGGKPSTNIIETGPGTDISIKDINNIVDLTVSSRYKNAVIKTDLDLEHIKQQDVDKVVVSKDYIIYSWKDRMTELVIPGTLTASDTDSTKLKIENGTTNPIICKITSNDKYFRKKAIEPNKAESIYIDDIKDVFKISISDSLDQDGPEVAQLLDKLKKEKAVQLRVTSVSSGGFKFIEPALPPAPSKK